MSWAPSRSPCLSAPPPSSSSYPFQAQGHVSPMLLLARVLAARGVEATLAVPDFVHHRIVGASQGYGTDGPGVELASIPSGVPDDGNGEPPGFAGFAHAREHTMPERLEEMLNRRALTAGRGVACLQIIDVLASWAVPVAERCGVPAVRFLPAMLATYRVVAAIPEFIAKGVDLCIDYSSLKKPKNKKYTAS